MGQPSSRMWLDRGTLPVQLAAAPTDSVAAVTVDSQQLHKASKKADGAFGTDSTRHGWSALRPDCRDAHVLQDADWS
eukprot:CAMPEP_0182842578 /NCGR_PEP_ID=MMETSP0006_2-20121128/25700_1 /TAXON_ID=97485 /ORGANISM="Prymnesium parvum, Strain Texoma1" /LENGTH=76 /DNA_ID=CAMNT_0024972255 /DNA_START=345 /DNA_END=576 /DNA_ORIENTATION=-